MLRRSQQLKPSVGIKQTWAGVCAATDEQEAFGSGVKATRTACTNLNDRLVFVRNLHSAGVLHFFCE